MCLNGGIPRLTAKKGCQFQMIDNKSNNNSNKIKTSHNNNKNTTTTKKKNAGKPKKQDAWRMKINLEKLKLIT